MQYTGGSYEGDLVSGRFDGHGTYTFPDGSKYVGEFKAGMFHGKGTVHNKNGSYSATWEFGKEVEGTFSFKDGLVFATKDWSYCTPEDRRFYTEAKRGVIKPAGQTQLTNQYPPTKIPPGCYDTGDGVYDPKARVVYKYGTQEELRKPTTREVKWAVSKCRIGETTVEADTTSASGTSTAVAGGAGAGAGAVA